MSRLAVDLTRLRDEISAAKATRETLIKNLKRTVTRMRAGFRNEHAQMAGRSQADRLAFISNLKHVVAGLRQEFAADLSAARRAWSGAVPPPVLSRDKADAEHRASAEAARRSREETEKRRLETEGEAEEASASSKKWKKKA
jgi:hypothetical protein